MCFMKVSRSKFYISSFYNIRLPKIVNEVLKIITIYVARVIVIGFNASIDFKAMHKEFSLFLKIHI